MNIHFMHSIQHFENPVANQVMEVDNVNIQDVSKMDKLQESVLYIKTNKEVDINICSEMSGFQV